MKKLYIILLAALVCEGAVAANHRFTSRKAAKAKTALVKKAAKAPVWRPATQEDYEYADGEWSLLGSATMTYDAAGNAIVVLAEDAEGSVTRQESTFDANNRPTSILTLENVDEIWANSAKRTYKYDTVLPGFCVERMGYDWNGAEWAENYLCETNEITRNADGKITRVLKSIPMGVMTPIYDLTWTYDSATGKAVAMAYYANYGTAEEPDWLLSEDVDYRNIEWTATDGQLVEPSVYDYVEGANRIASCDVYYLGDPDGHMFVEYMADGGYSIKDTYADPSVVGSTIVKTITDANGSYKTVYTEYFDEDGEYAGEETYSEVEEVVCDAHGNVVSEQATATYAGEETELMDARKYSYTYDAVGNVLEIVTQEYDFDEENYVNSERTVYSGYEDVAGIGAVKVDDNAPVEYFDLTGRKVAAPAKGIYIRRQGAVATKVII